MSFTRFLLSSPAFELVKDVIDDGSYAFTTLEQLKGVDSVFGLAFENLVVNHYREILPRLGLSKALVESAAPFSKKADSRAADARGCQIDLLVQTSEACCLVEIKRRKEIGDEAIDEMKAKVAALSFPKGISVRTALVYDGRLAPTVEAAGYFSSVVDVRELLS